MKTHTEGELLAHVVRLNVDKGYSYYDERESLADSLLDGLEGRELRAAIYREGVSEYGRCTGKVFVDTADGPVHVGYVFLKREEYDDYHSTDTYLCETWLTVERVVAPAYPTQVASVAL